MDQAQLNWLTSFIWNIADDVLRDVFVRGKYRDVILPMTVLRRLDAVLEATKPPYGKSWKSDLERMGEYEPDSELRDFEQIPLLEEGGIEAFIRREVLPYTPDAWIVEADTKIGYEISFTRHFYQPPQLRTLDQISADILALEQETEGLLHEITKGAAS